MHKTQAGVKHRKCEISSVKRQVRLRCICTKFQKIIWKVASVVDFYYCVEPKPIVVDVSEQAEAVSHLSNF